MPYSSKAVEVHTEDKTYRFSFRNRDLADLDKYLGQNHDTSAIEMMRTNASNFDLQRALFYYAAIPHSRFQSIGSCLDDVAPRDMQKVLEGAANALVVYFNDFGIEVDEAPDKGDAGEGVEGKG